MSSFLDQLDERGYARTGRLLTNGEAHDLAAAFDDDERYRSRVQMGRYRFGEGDYAYFAYPLPPVVARLRDELYPELAAVANEWGSRLHGDSWQPWPDELDAMLARCHAAGQERPTPLVLRYGAGGYNTLHQDLYGDIAFPLQVVVGLTEPGVDYTGGEFVLTEQRPRSQTRATALVLERGEGIVFPNNRRPVHGARGTYQVTHRHGASEVRSGVRVALGLIFHDAALPGAGGASTD
jgi:hypothetical protein